MLMGDTPAARTKTKSSRQHFCSDEWFLWHDRSPANPGATRSAVLSGVGIVITLSVMFFRLLLFFRLFLVALAV